MSRISPILLLIFCAGFFDAGAQGLMQKKNAEIFPTDGKKKLGGFYVAPGLTYGLTRFSDEEEELFAANDTSYRASLDPNGSLGLYLELGWFHAMRDPYILDYIDFGLSYKQLKGVEHYVGSLMHNDVELGATEGESSFSDSYLTLHFNANKLIQTSNRNFVQLSLGVNADYRIGRSLSEEFHPVDTGREYPPELLTQAHFKIGYGFKLNERFMIIPMLETPVFSVLPEDQGFGQLQWFNSLYRPVIFSVRFLWLRYPNGFDCPEVKSGGAGKKKKQQPYKPKSYHP